MLGKFTDIKLLHLVMVRHEISIWKNEFLIHFYEIIFYQVLIEWSNVYIIWESQIGIASNRNEIKK